MHVSYWIPRSYLTGVAQVQLLMTPVKYEWDLKNITDTFARSTILLTEKLTNGTLVTPTMGLSKIKAERESRGEYLNSLLIIRLSLTGKFEQNIIVLCICRHDMVATMMSNPGVSNKFDVDPLSNSDSEKVQIYSFAREADRFLPYLRGECLQCRSKIPAHPLRLWMEVKQFGGGVPSVVCGGLTTWSQLRRWCGNGRRWISMLASRE